MGRRVARTAAPTPAVKRTHGGRARRMAAKFTALLAMTGVIAFVVSVSVPAAAFYPAGEPELAQPSAAAELQSLTAAETAGGDPIARDDYTVTSFTEKLRAKYSARSYAYRNNPGGSIQWPFPGTVPIASGFGDRLAPCGGCTAFHEGLDFTPGAGTPIGAIAAGVVSVVSSDGAYGQHVLVDHVVNGQKIQSLYAHMLPQSAIVQLGQTVTAGQILGLVGSSGASTGAHLHLEIHVNRVPIDPFAWLKANAN